MRATRALTAGVALTVLAGTAHADAMQNSLSETLTPQRVIVKLRPEIQGNVRSTATAAGRTGVASLDTRLARIDAQTIRPLFNMDVNPEAKRAAGMDRFYVVDYGAPLPPNQAMSLVAGPELEMAEPEVVYRKMVTLPDDPDFDEQWCHINPVFPFGWTEDCDGDTPIAWDYETGDPNLIIAIIDSGVDIDHPEFEGRTVDGWDFVNNDDDPADDEGHGTACAGIAAASGNNGEGIAGVMWEGLIMPVKVLNDEGEGASSWVANGIEFAADNGADVISLSLGSSSPSGAIQTAVNYAFNTQGAILLAATGNDNNPTIGYPAAFANCMAVGAMSPCLERKSPSSCDGEGWWGSNYGTGIDFVAPGVDMFTTDVTGGGGYTIFDYFSQFNGTSSATPYAAGAAALVWSMYPSLTNAELRDLLRKSATDMGAPGYDLETGYGHVNPASAIQAHGLIDATGSLAGAAVSRGVSWGDVDDDGDADLYIVNDGSANEYYRNDNGTFVDATTGLLADAGSGYSAVFGDTDGDEDLDLYIVNDGINVFLRNDGGTFVDATVAPLNNGDAGTSSSWVDYEGDGDLDLYVVNDGTENKILQNDGSGVFTDVSALPLGNTRAGKGVAWTDYDNDGDQDLYLVNDGPNRLLRNDGGGVFSNDTGALLDNLTGHGTCWADVNNDGFMDLFVANAADGNRMWISDGAGTWTDLAAGTMMAETYDTRGCTFADLDNDGYEDLILTNFNGANSVYRNEGGVSFTNIVALGPAANDGQGQGVAAADYDCDGQIDFFVANADGANVLVRNDQPAIHHWIQLRLHGVTSNTGGIGARVQIVAGGVTQIRDVRAGAGYLSQNEATVAFGLGSATMIDEITVTWPSGVVDEVENFDIVDTKIDFIEGEGAATDAPEGPRVLQDVLAQNSPNPFSLETAIRFRLEEPSSVRLAVFGADGRRVRALVDGPKEAGEHLAFWDRRDDTGATVAAGVYFYQIQVAGVSESRRMVVVE